MSLPTGPAFHLTHGQHSPKVGDATHTSWLKKGFAEILTTRVGAHFCGTSARQIILKVDALKIPARALYEKMGFVRIPKKRSSLAFSDFFNAPYKPIFLWKKIVSTSVYAE